MKSSTLSAAFVLMFAASFVSAQEKKGQPAFTFWGRMTMGSIVSSAVETSGYDIPFEGEWLENFDGGVRVTRPLSTSLTGRLNIGVVINTSTVTPKGLTYEYASKKAVPVLLDASLQYRRAAFFGNNDTLTAEFGYFPFKYNAQSTNLGEYLFRSGTYPGWLISGFENSIDRPKLAGAHLGHVFGSDFRLQQDIIVNTELDVFPYHDINLSYIVTPSFRRLINFGLGVELARLIAVDPRKTTIGLDSVYKHLYDEKIGYIDTSTGDTIRYTFKGTKVMGRAMFDIKNAVGELAGLFGNEDLKNLFGDASGFFGREDLKVYGEAAVLGVKDYAGWYGNIKDRVPAMVGINWPTHQLLSYCVIPGVMGYMLEPKKAARRFMGTNVPEKMITGGSFGTGGVVVGVGSWLLDRWLHTNSKLDIISIEVEHYSSPYINAQDYIWKGASPVPYIAGRPSGSSFPNYNRDWADSMAQTNDDIKWSIYASKKFGEVLRISAQAACDHSPKNWYTPWPAPQSAKYTDMVPRTRDWYFMMRASFYF